MTVRAVEWKNPYTWGKGIEIDENKVISLRLRDENNLIIWDRWDNEIYVDLQLDDEIRPTDAFPVWITTGRVIIDNGWDKTWTLICAKTTSGDNIKIFYSDDGHLYVDHWTWLFTQVYLKPEVDALLLELRNYVDTELAKKQDKLIAWDNIEIAQDWKTISAILPPLNRFLSLWDCSTGMPISFPTSTLPFEYESWDHFLVETVDSTTNYRPSWTEYDGTASQTVETADVQPWDVYIYDGTTWLLQINHDKNVSFAQIAWQPSDNQALAQALNSKQDTLTAWTWINISNQNVISVDWTQTGVLVYSLPQHPISLQDEYVYSWTATLWGNTSEIDIFTDRVAIKNNTTWWDQNRVYLDIHQWKWELYVKDKINNVTTEAEYMSDKILSTWANTETYEFQWWGNNQIARLKDVHSYTAWNWISIDANNNISNILPWAIIASTAPSNPVQGNLWYDTTNDKLMSYDWTNWNECWGWAVTLEAWTGISIAATSAHKDNQWPCPDGFHIPTPAEWQDVIDLWITEHAWDSSNNSSDISNYLKLPLTGRIRNTGGTNSDTYYWSCQVDGAGYWHDLDITSSTASASDRSYKANAFPIRAFADTSVIPDSSWTIIVHGAGADDGIFWNQSLWLITITDGTNAITIMDKNLGATTVWSYWETVTADKAGKLYQWGNNHWFDWNTTPSTTSSSRVSASAYWPWNYYDNSTFIIYAGSWDSSNNDNLWGWVTLWTWGESWYRITALNNGDVVWPSSATDWHLAVFDWATGKIIKDWGILNDVKVSATAPSSPTEWMVWYDTTNDELKIYDGSAWNAVGGGWDVWVSTQANNVFTPWMKIWWWTSANYGNLTPDWNTAYLII